MITHSGAWIRLEGPGVPTPSDIAIASCRITRYAGALWVPLSAHSVLTAELAYFMNPRWEIWAAGMLHDAHEIITGEMPRPWKPDAVKLAQAVLDVRIATAFGLNESTFKAGAVKEADNLAIKLESYVLAPKTWLDKYRKLEDWHEDPPMELMKLAYSILPVWQDPMGVVIGSKQHRTLTEALIGIQEGRIALAREKLLSETRNWGTAWQP